MAFYMAPTPPDFGAQNTTTTGTSTAGSFIPSGSSVPTNGLYLPTANTLGLSTSSTLRLRLDVNNLLSRLGSALTTRLSTTGVSPYLQLSDLGAGGALIFNSAASSNPASLFFLKSRGTALGNVVSSGDTVFRLSGAADDGTQATEAGRIDLAVDGTPGSSSMPGRITLSVTPSGAATPVEKVRLTNPGNLKLGGTADHASTVGTHVFSIFNGTAPVGTLTNGVSLYSASGTLRAIDAAGAVTTLGPNLASASSILSSGATAGVGYATGAGTAQVQGTSRTTGVTANNVCGSIQLFSAAGSTTWTSFTVTNSAVAATDTVIVVQRTGTDLYEIHVTAVAAGSFRISFRTTGGTTTETPIFNFAVIKAVAA